MYLKDAVKSGKVYFVEGGSVRPYFQVSTENPAKVTLGMDIFSSSGFESREIGDETIGIYKNPASLMDAVKKTVGYRLLMAAAKVESVLPQ